MYQKRELDDCRGRSFLLVDHRCSLGQCSQDLNPRIARITTTEIAYGGTDCCSSVVLNTGASNYISRSLISREKPILGRKPQPCPMSKSIIIAIYNGICNYPHQPPKRVWDCFDDHLSQLRIHDVLHGTIVVSSRVHRYMDPATVSWFHFSRCHVFLWLLYLRSLPGHHTAYHEKLWSVDLRYDKGRRWWSVNDRC